jgi:hypothetical protein
MTDVDEPTPASEDEPEAEDDPAAGIETGVEWKDIPLSDLIKREKEG